MSSDDRVTYFALTDARSKRTPFGIKYKDRSRHIYVIGKTGMGKSTLLENMAIQDLRNGEGVAFLDPHGKTADLLLDYVPEDRIQDVVYFAPFDTNFPISFNIMEDVGPDKRHLVANGLLAAFEKIWVDAWSARMEYILNNTILALLEYPDSTLLGINRMLTDKSFRKKVMANISDTSVKAFWVDEYEKWDDRYAREAGAAIQNKVGQFVSNPLVRNIIGQPKSSFDLRTIMDEKKIVIVNLSKGQVGESNANLLGSMLITRMYLAAMSRADSNEMALAELPQFHLYVDEFQSFANKSFEDILSESRKYHLSLTIAHQYIEQMAEEVRAAVFGNVGTMISFRVGSYDAEILEKEFAPQFIAEDMVNLGFTQIYLKLMIDGVSSQPFSAVSMPPIPRPEISFKKEIINHSRAHFTKPRVEVERAINEWYTSSEGESREDRSRKDKQTQKPHGEKREQKKNLSRGIVVPEQSLRRQHTERTEEAREVKQAVKRPQPKKEKREASKENVNALRDALAGALARVKQEEKQKHPEQIKQQERNGHIHKQYHQEQRTDRERNQQQNKKDDHRVERPREEQKQSKHIEDKQQEKHKSPAEGSRNISQGQAKEVPKDVLQNILKMEE